MKSLLRRKTPTDNVKKPSPPSSTQYTRQPPTTETPLYARFASTKPAAQPLEKTRLVVSGPMPLGRPSRANPEADSRRKHEDENLSRGRLSSGRRVLTGPESQLDAHEFRPSLDRSSQDVPVDLRPPTKTRTASFPDEQLTSSRSHNIAATENVQYRRDILPSPPVSPPPSLYPQQLMRTTINGSPSSSLPSVGKASATATEVPAATMRSSGLYGEPRYPTSRSPEKPPFTKASTSSVMKSSHTESSHKPANSFSAMGNSLSSNQASHDLERPQSIPASLHQGAALAPHLNGRVERTRLSTAPLDLPLNVQISQDQFDRRASRALAGDTSLRSTGTPPPQDSAYRNIYQALGTETAPAPFIVTPPQSPDKHATSTRRTTTQSRGHRHVLAAPDPEPEPAPEPTRRGPLIFNAQEAESRHVSQERESARKLGQGGYQHPQVTVKPLPTRPITGSPERGSVVEPRRSISHSQSFKQEQVTRAFASYEDEAPPTAHPAIRKISKGSTAKMHTPPFRDDRTPSFAEHSSNSRHSNRLRKQRSPPADLSSASSPAFMQDSPQSAWQAHQSGNISVLSPSQPVRERNTSSSPDSSTPPTPPEKSPSPDARIDNEWSHHIERQFSSKRPASTIDVEIEPQRDVRNGWAVPVPAEAQFEEDDPTPSNVEDGQEDVQATHLLNGFSRRESRIRSASSIDANSWRAPTSVGQLQDDSYDSVVDASDPQMDEPNEPVFEYGPQHPENATQRPWEDEDNLASQSFVDNIEPVVRPRRRTLPPPPASPEEYSRARARRRGTWLEKAVPADIAELAEETKPTFYPLLQHLQNRELLTELLTHFSFCEWLILWGGVSKAIRQALDSDPALCDVALERYLGTVGYARWSWSNPEPIRITLAEMRAYMRGVGKPVHVYAQTSFSILSSPPSEENAHIIHDMKKETRAFNRIVIRLRAQAEADVEQNAVRRRRSIGQAQPPQRQNNGPPLSWSAGKAQGQGGRHRSASRQSSRAPSPTNSMWSQGASSQVHLPLGTTPTSSGFKSPLFRLRRAALLRVFVPSPEGDWLSDAGVLECETELRKAGILPLLRVGDVVWDTALGDEGNVGRLVWDGRYLIDLDYAFSQIGDIPPSLPALAFPPSYFHRVIRVAGDRNPIAHLDVRFWGEEIIANLQLLQDRVRTETPQGAYHTVVRWVHRSSFTIFPPPGGAPVIILPNKERRLVDPGWRGTVIVEAEGTNEGLSDLHARCRGVFQPRAGDVAPPPGERERMVWRVLRERSRPGEIWIRAVSYKERLTP